MAERDYVTYRRRYFLMHAFGTLASVERFSVIDIAFFTPSLGRAHIQSVFGYGAIDAGPRLMFRFRSGTQ